KSLGLGPLRWDWSPPLILDVTNPDVLYVGSQYVFRCEILQVAPDGYADHRCPPTSGDFSAQQSGPFPGGGGGYPSYGALFSLAQSTADPSVLWAGADDGWIHVSRDR